LPRQHVEQLRELVQLEPPQPHADPRDTRISSRRQLISTLFSIRDHGSELPHFERLTLPANARLLEENGAAIIELDGERDEHEFGPEERKPQRRGGDIEESLGVSHRR